MYSSMHVPCHISPFSVDILSFILNQTKPEESCIFACIVRSLYVLASTELTLDVVSVLLRGEAAVGKLL